MGMENYMQSSVADGGIVYNDLSPIGVMSLHMEG